MANEELPELPHCAAGRGGALRRAHRGKMHPLEIAWRRLLLNWALLEGRRSVHAFENHHRGLSVTPCAFFPNRLGRDPIRCEEENDTETEHPRHKNPSSFCTIHTGVEKLSERDQDH